MPYASAEARAAYQRSYRRAHAAGRAAERPDYDRARHANQRAAAAGAPGRITVADVRIVLAAARCHYCSDGISPLTLDHRIPLSRGGANELSNLVAACFSCNASKWTGDEPYRWARRHTACIRCGTSTRKHAARGMCNACYLAESKKRRAA